MSTVNRCDENDLSKSTCQREPSFRAAALSEPRDAIEDIIEPFLIQCGYLQRTPRGRLLTSHAFRHLGLAEPARDPAQFGLFGGGEEE